MEAHIFKQLIRKMNQKSFPVNLQNMAEDCLLDIFSHLDLMDLISIGETCKRLRRIVQRAIIPKKLLIKECKSDRSVTIGKFYYHRIDREIDIERVLKVLGPCLTEVSACGSMRYKSGPITLCLLDRYCDVELKSLRIENMWISENLAKELKPVFDRLQKLHLHQVRIDGDMSLFEGLNSLVELEIEQIENCGRILHSFYPKLKRFIYCNIGMTANVQNCCMPITQTIANCTELEELQITTGTPTCVPSAMIEPLKHLKQLKSLQILNMRSSCMDNYEGISSKWNESELELNFCDGPYNSKHVQRLAQPTKLWITYRGVTKPFKVHDVVNIIRHLEKLEELDIYDKRTVIDEKTFSEIISVVNGRQETLTLKGYFDFDLGKYDWFQAVRPVLLSRFAC